MLRSLSLGLAFVCAVSVLGCRSVPDQNKMITVLEDRLVTCARDRDGYSQELKQLQGEYQEQSEALSRARGELENLDRLRQELQEAAMEREERLQELRKLVQNISGMRVESRQEGDFIVIENEILFAAGKIELSDQARSTLDQTVVAYLRKHLSDHPEQPVRIDGHTDGQPIRQSGWSSNHHLAAMRAHAVMQYLVSRDIPQGNVYIVGFGPNRPLVEPPESEADVPENRRVEILLVPKAARGVEDILEKFRQ